MSAYRERIISYEGYDGGEYTDITWEVLEIQCIDSEEIVEDNRAPVETVSPPQTGQTAAQTQVCLVPFGLSLVLASFCLCRAMRR